MNPWRWSCGSFVILIGVAALVSGCGGEVSGPPRATIAGKVTLDGKPVEGGEIRFLPAKGAETVS